MDDEPVSPRSERHSQATEVIAGVVAEAMAELVAARMQSMSLVIGSTEGLAAEEEEGEGEAAVAADGEGEALSDDEAMLDRGGSGSVLDVSDDAGLAMAPRLSDAKSSSATASKPADGTDDSEAAFIASWQPRGYLLKRSHSRARLTTFFLWRQASLFSCFTLAAFC